jgi:hypothetical protein
MCSIESVRRIFRVHLCSTLIASTCLLHPVAAQERGVPPKSAVGQSEADKELEAAIGKLTQDLDADRKAVRDEAEARLIAYGPSILDRLPALSADASDEMRMRFDRVRESLEKLEVKTLGSASLVTLKGKLTGKDALAQISQMTGNPISTENAPNLDTLVTTDFEEAPFWESVDDILDQLQLTVARVDGEQMLLQPRAKQAPIRSATAGYSGPYRLEPMEVHKNLRLHEPESSNMEVHLMFSWEPRLMPVYVKFLTESMKVQCDDGSTLQPKIGELENEFVPAGGSQLELEMAFALPDRAPKKILRWSGDIFVAVPGKLAKLEFSDLMKANNQKATIGSLAVVLEKARKNRDIYEILVGVSLKGSEGSSESFRGWSNLNDAYLIDSNNQRIEHVGWSTTRMNDNEVGLSYLFDVEKGLDGCKFIYRAPASIVEQTHQFILEDIPLP